MLELKEGRFAVIVKGEINNSNVGKIVYLTKYLGEFENDFGSYKDAWHIFCPDGLVVPSRILPEEGIIESDRLIAINSKFLG